MIYRASIFFTDVEDHPFIESSIGEIVDVFPSNKFLVRCSNGVLIVHEYSGPTPQATDCFLCQESPFTRFSRNEYGFFDV